MPVNHVSFDLVPLPHVQFSGDIAQLAQLLVDHLEGTLDNSAFTGQFGGSEPTTDIGLWFNATYWEQWNTVIGKYWPIETRIGKVIGSTVYTARIKSGGQTGNIDITLPATTGTLALEGGGGPNTGTLQDNTITIDWSLTNLYASISANVTVVDSGGARDGQAPLDLWIETPPNTGSAFTLTFPNQWRKSDATLSTTDATHRAVDHFRLSVIGGEIFAEKIGTFTISTTTGGSITEGGMDSTAPVFVRASIDANSSRLVVEFDELLIGSTPSNKWVIQKNAITQTLSSLSISGKYVIITLASPILSTDTLNVKMLAASGVTDIAGNAAVAFGPGSADVVI